MAKANQKLDEMTVPDGGIGNFIMDDAEIEAAYGDDDDGMEEYGDEGIAQFPALTKKMAAMGREGDDVVAHLQTGEIVIPLALIEQDEALKEGIFQRLRDMGVEDPERYVVGSEANSINPNTGAAEFFFKKLIKKVAKAVKSVVKVVKKVAPIVLPILGSMVLGPVYGAALGSGIASLINGGSIKDALKSALISGATGGLMAGVSGMVSGVGFGAGVSAALNPANISAGFGAVKTMFTDGLDASGIGFDSMKYGIAGGEQVSAKLAEQAAAAAATGAGASAGAGTTPTISSQGAVPGATNAPALTPEAAANNALTGPTGAPVTARQAAQQAVQTTTPNLVKPPSFMESIKDAFTPGGRSFTESLGDAFFPSSTLSGGTIPAGEVITNPSANQYLQASGVTPLAANAAQQTAAQKAVEAVAPGLLRTYGPLAAVGTGLAAASGFFSSPEQEPVNIAARDENGNIITGEDLIDADPSKYLVGDLGSLVFDPNTGTYVPRSVNPVAPISDLTIQAPTYSTYQAPTQYGLRGTSPYLQGSTPGGPFARPYVTQAAQGGAIFPRRNGGIMPEEGIPGQDSVRAMLMPGEFVMTTDAVRGAGNGNLNNGIKNMYSVMRDLEARGRA